MKKPPAFTRRAIVKGMTMGSLLPLLGANLVGCSDNSSNAVSQVDSVPASFGHGVASGDPLEDRVILWTRVTPERAGKVLVDWEIATDAGFANVINSGSGVTDGLVDYTLKVDADGLDPGTTYYYRFTSGANTSPPGRTRTLPIGVVGARAIDQPANARYAGRSIGVATTISHTALARATTHATGQASTIATEAKIAMVMNAARKASTISVSITAARSGARVFRTSGPC